VLRGDKQKFQLFGETVDKAAQMEASSMAGRIQVSSRTADLLKTAGKEHWLIERTDKKIQRKGVEVQTYWLDVNIHAPGSTAHETDSDSSSAITTNRLVAWSSSLLVKLLKEVVARREATDAQRKKQVAEHAAVDAFCATIPLAEVKEIIHLPKYDAKVAKHEQNLSQVELDPVVVEEAIDYMSTTALLYR